ncbi:hypothetical protein [Rhodanobacter hydrolyticus]|uniref:Uncharacterized protein n=1 Tax=Rhodanobacter hydrolyticus TaxID=2250595 RepID=A0ABW8J413_9GAMM
MTIALLSGTSAVAADSTPTPPDVPRIESVLVQVDAQGKVTETSPAYALSPSLTQLLDANVRQMIRSPGTDKNGKPIPTQFLMNLSLESKPNSAGGYDVHFAYVSSKPLPFGSWYWTRLPDDRVELANAASPSSRDSTTEEAPPPSSAGSRSSSPPSNSSPGSHH